VVEVVWDARGAVEIKNKPGAARLAVGGVGVVGTADNLDKYWGAFAGAEEEVIHASTATVFVSASDGAVADSYINANAEGQCRNGLDGCGTCNSGSSDLV
jgi:hypothetical protein